jgi:hypothetical protein
MNDLKKTPWLTALLLVSLLCLVGGSHAESLEHFITRDGDQFRDGSAPYRFISFNIPNLLVIEDAFSFTEPNPWRWPNEFELEDALESVRQMGGQVVRTYVISVYREGADMAETVHVLRPGEFNEEGFQALDKALEIANRKGVRLIIPLVDNWKWMGGIGDYAAFRGKPADAFWSDPQIIDDFKKTVAHVINRKNSYTGVAYRDDKAIFGWETGNEIDATPEWTREIAAYIKQLDKNHLVIDGRSLHGVPIWSLEDPHVDAVTTHHYPHASSDFVTPIRAAHAIAKGKKPYFVGEFGFVETERIRQTLEAVVEDGVPGALLWSLRFHRREGGFYWHMEGSSGRNIYKAYHWPGFDSGDVYDERKVLAMMQLSAFKVRQIQPDPIEIPAQPVLLPIGDPAHISWQGSAGADRYDVSRANNSDGPWQTVGEGISDAAYQYRPLFHDESAIPGQSYYYRITALNGAGASEPSNVVGPVRVKARWLVDECKDRSLVESIEGDVRLETKNARQTQEDLFRFAIGPGGSVTYRVDLPISSWEVFAFYEEPAAELQISTSVDGENFVPSKVEREAFGSGQGDYGYFVPVLFRGEISRGATHLRISRPGDEHVRDALPLEISRVEIEYGEAE